MSDSHLRIIQAGFASEMQHNDNYAACTSMLRHCRVIPEIIVDAARAARVGGRKASTSNGFVIVTSNKTLIYDFMQLAKWIKKMDLMLMV